MSWLALVLLSAIFLAIATLLVKRDLTHETNTQLLALYLLFPAAFLALTRPIDYGILVSATGFLLLTKTLILGLACYLATLALERLPMSIHAPLKNLSPIFLLFLGILLLDERIGLVQVAGLFIIVAGAVLLDLDIRRRHVVAQLRRFFGAPAILLMLLHGLLISFCPIMDRLILRETDPSTTLFFSYALVSLLFWVVHLAKERRNPLQGIGVLEAAWLLATGAFTLASDLFLFESYLVPGTVLVVLIGVRRLSNLFATVFGGRIFHEDHLLYKGSMCLVMIIGTLLLVL